MFEKEAKEWVKTKGTDAITCIKENIGYCTENKSCNSEVKKETKWRKFV